MHEYFAAVEGYLIKKYEKQGWFRAVAWQTHWAHAKRAMKPEKFWPIPTDNLKSRDINTDLFRQHFQRKAQDIVGRKFSTYQKHLKVA